MGTPIQYTKGGSDFTPLPEGTYDFQIKGAKQGTSKKGNAQLEIDLEVLDGDHAGAKMRTWYSLLPQAGFRLTKLVGACGVEEVDTGEKGADGLPVMSFDLDELPGRMFRAEVKHRDYEGKTQVDLKDEGESPFAVKAGGQKPTAGGEQTTAAPATPSTAGAPVQQRRPRPAPATS